MDTQVLCSSFNGGKAMGCREIIMETKALGVNISNYCLVNTRRLSETSYDSGSGEDSEGRRLERPSNQNPSVLITG